MEPGSSLPHSQVPATCPYPEPDQSNPFPHIPLPEDPLRYYPPFYAWSPKWSLSLRFPHQHPLHASPLPHTRYMPRLSHSSRFYHPHYIGWAVQIIHLLLMQPPSLPCYLVPPRPKYSPQHPTLKHPQSTFLPQCERPSFTPIQNNKQNYSSVYINLCIFG